MHRIAIYKRITFILVFLLYGLRSLATGGDSSGKSVAPLPVSNIFTGYPAKTANTANTTNRSFAQLDQYINGQQFTFQPSVNEFTDQYFEQVNTDNPIAEEYKARARATMSEVESSNSYVDYLEPSDI